MSKPNPGSYEAIKQGCTCPIIDNGHGNLKAAEGRGWWISGDCPLHAYPADPAGEVEGKQ